MTEPVVPENTRSLHVIDVREGAFRVKGSGDTSGFAGLTRQITMPGATSRPFGGWFDAAADRLFALLNERGVDGVEYVVIDRDEMTFFVRRQHLVEVSQLLRDDAELRFEMCLGISGAHFPQDAGREFHTMVHLLSFTHNRRIRLEVTAPESDNHIPTLTPVWPNDDWHEREAYDFFGIIFDGHPGLTRLMMPDDWVGHPQRKDYPLGGIEIEYKGATTAPVDQRRSYS